jgi:hypothetical protein
MGLLFEHCLIQINACPGVALGATRPESCVVTVLKKERFEKHHTPYTQGAVMQAPPAAGFT